MAMSAGPAIKKSRTTETNKSELAETRSNLYDIIHTKSVSLEALRKITNKLAKEGNQSADNICWTWLRIVS